MTNTIVRDNIAPEAAGMAVLRAVGGEGELTVSYSNVKDGESSVFVKNGALVWGKNNVDADPLIAFANNARLISGSPCIDAGTNEILPALPPVDPDGNARSLDGDGDGVDVVDIGAFEFNANAPTIAVDVHRVAFRATIGGADPPDQVLSIRNAGGETLDWSIVSECSWLRAIPDSGNSSGEVDPVALRVSVAGLPRGVYQCELSIRDSNAVNDPVTIPVTLHVTTTLRVPTQYATIQDAIDDAVDSDQILLAPGVYRGPRNRGLSVIRKDVTIRGDGAPSFCVIDAEQADRGLHVSRGKVTLEGVTITNGSAQNGAAVLSENSTVTLRNSVLSLNRTNCNHSLCGGGGIDATFSDLVIEASRFTRNHSAGSSGGAISLDVGSLLVTDSLFDENTSPFGGGAGDIRSALVRFTRCTFRDNETMGSTASGGALAIYSYLEGGGAFDCDFVNNAASFEGGAIDLGATRERSWTISGCSFVSNLADRGGAIYMDTAEGVQVEDCLFDTNTGGGVYMRGGSAVSFRRSRFTNNTLQGSGAGAYVERSPVLFEKCLFDGNMCSSPGAGVYSLDAAVTVKWCEFRNNGDRQGAFHGRGTNDTPVLIGCYVHDNESGGLQFENGSNPIVQDCMIVNNSFGLWVGQFAAATVIANTTIAGNAPSFSEPGGGLTVWSGALDLRNSLVSRNTPGLQDIRIGSGVVADVAYTLVRDGQAGIENLGGTLNWLEGNLDAPPRFVDFQAGDFHLASDSPCIDGGDPALGPGTGRTDFEGQLRIWDGDGDGTSRVDMGADEFGAPSLGDLNCDGEINAFDIEPFILALTDPGSYGLAYPGCDHRAADVNRDGAVDAFDVEPFIGRLLEP